MANNKQQKKAEVKKSNTEEDLTGVVATSSTTQATTSDVYEFVSTPKHSSCSSGDENPVKSFDKCSDNDKSETDSDTLMALSTAGTPLNVQQQKRTLGDQQDRSEDNLSPAEDDLKRKKRKDSEFPPSSSTTNSTVCKEGKSSLPGGTNRVTSRVGQKPPGPASKTMGLIGKNNDKSPCESPKMSADTSEVENDDATRNSSDSNPKVPPLKIVIPQQTQQTQQIQTAQNQVISNEAQDQQGTNNLKTSIKTQRNISSTSSTLPYVLNASSNSNDSNSNDKTETSNAAGRSQSPTESNKSNNEDGKQTTAGGKSKEPRVLRSSQRGGKDSKDDRSSNNSSPQLPASSTPSPAAQNSGDSSSAGTESEVTSTAVNTSQNVPSQLTSNSSSLLSAQQQTQNQQQTSSSSSSQTSVELHPRKRKIKVSSSSKDTPISTSSSTSINTAVTAGSSTVDTKDNNSKDGSEKAPGSESTHPHDQPSSNCYQMYIDLRKQINQRHRNLHPIEPRPLKGLEDYLMNRKTYTLHGKTSMELNIIIPPLLPNPMKDTFCEQEKERHKLKMRHIVEKEKLVLSKEQEILRVHCKAAQMIANQAVPFSTCTILKDEEVYNIITPEQEEKYRNKNRERSHGRVFYQALKELDDKWDRIKVKFKIMKLF